MATPICKWGEAPITIAEHPGLCSFSTRTEVAVTHFVRSHLISMMFHSNNTRAWLALQSKDDKNVVKSGSPFTHWAKITSKYDMVIFWLYLPPAQTSYSSSDWKIHRVDRDTWRPKFLRWLQTLHRRSFAEAHSQTCDPSYRDAGIWECLFAPHLDEVMLPVRLCMYVPSCHNLDT